MKGTRLWQAPGSPIIQGRSRNERPFWEVWAIGALWAEVAVLVIFIGWQLRVPGQTLVRSISAVFTGTLIPSLAGAMAGAALGTVLARAMGWRRPWLGGFVLGALAGIVSGIVL